MGNLESSSKMVDFKDKSQYFFVAGHCKMVLDLDGPHRNANANIWNPHHRPNQHFRFIKVEKGFLIEGCNGQFLTVEQKVNTLAHFRDRRKEKGPSTQIFEFRKAIDSSYYIVTAFGFVLGA